MFPLANSGTYKIEFDGFLVESAWNTFRSEASNRGGSLEIT